ncbi:MAG: hypothetical protein AAFR87_30980 [Bacteroidota bacterium]
MKKSHTYFILLIVATLFSSCQSLYFSQAQPKGVAPFTHMPAELQGNYLSLGEQGIGEEIIYHVHQDGFTIFEEYEVEIPLDSLEAEDVKYELRDSLIFIEDLPIDENGFPYKIEGDSIFFSFYRWDEQKLGMDLVISKDKGFYYLSTRNEDGKGWEVMQLERLRNGDLAVWMVNPKEEEKLMREVLGAQKIEAKKDGDWKADPSKGKLRKYIKQGGFGELASFLHKLDEDDLPKLFSSLIEKY